MNREIKFRAWSKEGKKMMDWDFIKSVKNLHKLLTLNHVVVMQFTGIRDDVGKEVYESDKVIYTLNHDSSQKETEAVIEWHNHAWRLNRIWLLTEIRNIKIVGNIHEAKLNNPQKPIRCSTAKI